MNILIVQPFLSYGGAEAVSLQLAYHWSRRGYQVKVVALYSESGKLPYLGDQANLVCAPWWLRPLFARSKTFLLLFGFPILLWLTWRESKRVELLNPHNFPSLWAAGMVGSLRKIKVIWTCHNFPQTPFVGNLADKLLNPVIESVNRFFAQRCRQVVAVSKKVKNQIHHKYQVEPKVIHPAISLDFYAKGKGSKIRKQFNLKNKYVILQVARLKKEKNQELAIRSLAKIAIKIENVILILVGDGEEKKMLERLAKKMRVLDRVIFAGYQIPEQVRNFYDACDLHIAPAFETEGCNLTPFEALCLKKVSLVAEGSGVDGILKKEQIGLVAKPTVEEFGRQILWTYSHGKEVREMGNKGRRWTKENLSWHEYIQKFESMI